MLDIVHLMGDDVGSHRVKSSPRVRRGWIPTPLCRTYSPPGTEGKSAASGGLSGAALHARGARGARYAGHGVAMIVAGRSPVAGDPARSRAAKIVMTRIPTVPRETGNVAKYPPCL